MKKFLLGLMSVLMFTGITLGQLSGDKFIPGSGGPNDYATIEAAIAALNSQGVGTGGVTFNVAAGHTETLTSETAGTITATGTLTNQIVFKKAGGGANPLITAYAWTAATAYDGMIIIAGGDYITFEAIDLQENALNTTNFTDWGYALVKASATAPFNGCQNVTIKNCAITLNKANTSSVGIYVANHVATATTSLSITDPADANNNNKFFGNTISNVYIGIRLAGYLASSPYTLYDQNNEIGVDGANTITNYGGGSSTAYGTYAIYQNNLKVANNTINGGAGTTTTLYGIFNSTGTSSNVDIYNNIVTIQGGATSSSIYGINNAMGSTAAGNTVNIYDNIVQNCTYPTATSGAMYAVYNSASAATVNMYDNTVNGNVLPGTGSFYGIYGTGAVNLNMYQNNVYENQKTGASGSMYLTYLSTSIIDFHHNNLYNNAFTNSSGTSAAIVYGYYNLGSPTVENLYNNNIYNNTVAGSNTATGSYNDGIYTNTTSSGVKNIYNNNIYGLSALSGNVNGIRNSLGTAYIYKNKIYDLSNAVTTTTVAAMNGITVTSGTNVYIYNNYISDLQTPASASVDAIRGINITSSTSSSTIGLYYNTLYLDAVSSGTNFGTSGVFHTYSATATTAVLDMRNNIIVNNSTPVGTGFTVAFRRSASTSLVNYGSASNNNDLYAGTPSASNLIFYDGNNALQTIGEFKTQVSPRDAFSVSENPPFLNVSTTPYDLHLSTAVATTIESGGTPVTTPVEITDDFDGNTRNATLPDIGADEGDFTPNDVIPPVIVYDLLTNQSNLISVSLTATITDLSAIATGANAPRLYIKKINDASYVFDNNPSVAGDSYTFTVNYSALGGVVIGDTIQYYVAAQDVSGNAGTNPSGGSGANPPGTTPPASPNSYAITDTPLSGTYTVGLAAFKQLTGKQVYFETKTKEVTVQVNGVDALEDMNAGNNEKGSKQTASDLTPEYITVTKTYNVLMENGKPFDKSFYQKNTEGIYPTLTEAINDLIVRGMSGPVTFSLVDNNYPSETYPIDIPVIAGASATNTITIKPAAGVSTVIPGSAAQVDATFRIGYGSYVIVDGSNTVGGTTKDMKIVGLAAGTVPAVHLYGDANNNVFKNLIIESQNNSTGSGTFLFGSGPFACDNNMVENCTIKNIDTESVRPAVGVYFFSTNTGSGNQFKNCSVYDFTDYGFRLQGAPTTNTLVSGCDVYMTTASSKTIIHGLYIDRVDGLVIENSKISELISTNPSTITGIYFYGASASGNATVRNNFVSLSGFANLTAGTIRGIDYYGFTANSFEVYHNSIYLGGTDVTTGTTYALVKRAAATTFKAYNNAVHNGRSNSSGTGKHYAVYVSSTTATTFEMDYNDYFTDGTGGVLGYYSADAVDLEAWQTASGKDANSVSGIPQFITLTDLHVNTALPSVLNNAGLYLASVPFDIDGDTRSLTTPDIGADEYTYAPPSCPPPSAQNVPAKTNISADLAWTENGSATTWHVELGLQGFTPTGLPGNYVVVTSNPYTYTGLTAETSYDWYVRAYCGPGSTSTWTGPHTFQTLPAPLSGTYTINSALPTGGTNFASFTDFATALNQGWLAGAVTANVVAASGPYTEQVIINTVTGSSAVNTVTINGNGETLQYLSTNTNERATFKLNSTDYFTVNNLIFKSLGTTTSEYGFTVQLMNGSDYNTFSGCQFIADIATTSTNYCPFVTSNSATSATTSGLAVNYLTVNNCIAVGGYYGMVINGPTATPYSVNNTITNNEIKNFYYYGLYIRGQNNSVFSGNEISRPDRATSTTEYMVYLTSDMSNSVFAKNRIFDFSPGATTTSTAYGIYGTTLTATLEQELLIANNVIYGYAGMNGINYGMYFSTTSALGNLRIYHNSVSTDNIAHPGSSSIYAFYHTGATANLDIRNNIFAYTSNSTGTKYCMYFSTNTAVVSSNNNVLFRGATAGTNNTGYWSATAYNTLENWQTANGGIYDLNSVDADPFFTSPLLTPQNEQVNDIGANLLSFVPDDIFGTTRTETPDPGAIEFSPATCLAPTLLTVTNITPFTADLGWTGPLNAASWDIELGLAGFTPTGIPTEPEVANPFTYTGLSASTDYEFYVRANCDGEDFSTWAGPQSFTTLVSCPAPTGLTLVSKTPFTATLQWTSSASSFDIEYGVSPYTFTGVATQSGITNPVTLASLIPATTYQYKVKAICGVGDESLWSETGSFMTDCDYPTITSTTPGSRCGIGTVELAATASDPLAEIKWYENETGGLPLGTGSPFTTPVISETTDFYVSAASEGGGSMSVASPTPGISTFITQTVGWGLLFTINEPVTIQSVTIKASASAAGSASMTIQILTPTNTVLYTATPYSFDITTTLQEYIIPVNISLEPGDFKIGMSSTGITNLVRESSGITYPYSSPSNEVVITAGATGTGSTTSSYYWFYYWQITGGCESPRTAVTATVTPPPALTITGDQTICSNSITSITVTSPLIDYDVYTWSPIAGLFTDSECTVPYAEDQNLITVYVQSPVVGVLTYTCSASNTVSGCATNTSTNINLLPTPSEVTVTPDQAIADGSIQQLVASGGGDPVDVPVLTENFNSGAPGWTITAGSSNPLSDFTSIASPYTGGSTGVTFSNFSTLDGGNFMLSNSDAGGSGSTTNTTIVSPVFSLAGSYLSAKVNFEHIYRKWTTGDVYTNVEISVDGGTNWTELINYVPLGDQGVTTNNLQQTTNAMLDLTTYLGQTNLRLRFRYENSWGYFWLIDNVVVTATVPGSADYIWSPVTNLWLNSDATVPYEGQAVSTVYANPTSPVIYSATVTGGNGCTSSGTCEFIVLGYKVSGNVYYGTTGTTKPMATNTTVTLDPHGSVSTTTDGYYELTNVADGTYKLGGTSTKPWGGLQAFDATLVARYLGAIVAFNNLQKRAADLNMSNTITAFDGTLIKRRLGAIAVPQWTAPDFVFDGPFPGTPALEGITVTVSGANVTQELRTICSGDLNSSYTPPAK